MEAHWPKSDVTTSNKPLRSKSSTMRPPDMEERLMPAAGATSTKWPTSSADSKLVGEVRYWEGTPAGYFPNVIYARLSIQRTSSASGLRCRYFSRYSMAFSEEASLVKLRFA